VKPRANKTRKGDLDIMTTQLKHFLKRCTAALGRRPGSQSRTLYLLAASVILVGVSLAAADIPNPAPGPSQKVLEQNLDENGLIRVHEQGTATVNVIGGIVRATIPPATTSFWHRFVLNAGAGSEEISFLTINASAIHVQMGDFQGDNETRVFFKSPLVDAGFAQGLFLLTVEENNKGNFITFTQPVPINGVEVHCKLNAFCSALVSVVGVPTATP
jgi:hypothetical protein